MVETSKWGFREISVVVDDVEVVVVIVVVVVVSIVSVALPLRFVLSVQTQEPIKVYKQ